jgi:hypothetical protein
MTLLLPCVNFIVTRRRNDILLLPCVNFIVTLRRNDIYSARYLADSLPGFKITPYVQYRTHGRSNMSLRLRVTIKLTHGRSNVITSKSHNNVDTWKK